MAQHIVVIGAGFGGLSAAAYLAQAGYRVTILEKTDQPGGRARVLKEKGFTFDMGPSWYMMPDVFDDFFADFGVKPTDYYKLTQLNPSYRVFSDNDQFDAAPDPEVRQLFAQKDPGSEQRLETFLNETGKEYKQIRNGILEQPMLSPTELLRRDTLSMLGMGHKAFRSYHWRAKKVTKQPDLQHMLEFMSVFMGGSPDNIPAIYSLLSYVDMGLGVFYPDGGFGAVARAFESVAKKQGAQIQYSAPVEKVVTKGGKVTGVRVNGEVISCDAVVANADYEFVETQLLSNADRSYDKQTWAKKTVSPSGLLLFLGTKKRVPNLLHHNLFFDADWQGHFDDIFKYQRWTDKPLFYVSVPSKTDDSVAPKGYENMFVLAPMAAGVEPTKKQLQSTVDNIIDRIEQKTGAEIRDNLVVHEVRTQKYFTEMFNAYKGNAFGLSHTLRQSIFMRPPIASRKVDNLFFTGQYTNPGTGVPMVILSGKVSTNVVKERFK